MTLTQRPEPMMGIFDSISQPCTSSGSTQQKGYDHVASPPRTSRFSVYRTLFQCYPPVVRWKSRQLLSAISPSNATRSRSSVLKGSLDTYSDRGTRRKSLPSIRQYFRLTGAFQLNRTLRWRQKLGNSLFRGSYLQDLPLYRNIFLFFKQNDGSFKPGLS